MAKEVIIERTLEKLVRKTKNKIKNKLKVWRNVGKNLKRRVKQKKIITWTFERLLPDSWETKNLSKSSQGCKGQN